ncbi:MAG: hypothetical protein ACRYE8_06295 [Janthinobacterium lividum]
MLYHYLHCVIPWLVHGIQKNNNFNIYYWIPWTSHGITEVN